MSLKKYIASCKKFKTAVQQKNNPFKVVIMNKRLPRFYLKTTA